MARIGLAPPWITYVNEVTQMFLYDPEVHVVYNNDECEVKLYVDTASKAAALTQLMPSEREFGNVVLRITIVPANNNVGLPKFSNKASVYNAAFNGNGAFAFTKQVTGIFSNDLVYVVFKNKVVQFFNDDLSDIYGQCSTLYQNIAKDVFNDAEGVFFCTDAEEPVYGTLRADVASPLGEWP